VTVWSTHFPPPDPVRPERPPVLVPEGFSFWGLVLGWPVFWRPHCLLVAALAGLSTLLIGLLARWMPGGWVLLPAFHLTIALFGRDWRRWELGLAGHAPGPLVVASSRDEALRRLFAERPDLVVRAVSPTAGPLPQAGVPA